MGRVSKIARRTFLVGSAAVAGGAAFTAWRVQTPFKNPLEAGLGDDEAVFTQFIKITKDGVTLVTPRADKGQGAYSLQTYLMAEELGVDPLSVKTTVGTPSKAYANFALGDEMMPGMGKILGKTLMPFQMTGGSSTVPDMYERMRIAGAVARETLKKAAANSYDVSVEDLSVENGNVILPDGKRVSFGSLAPIAAKIKPVTNVALKDPEDWIYLGKDMLRTDIVAKSTGTHLYGIDLEFENMVYAAVRANPALGAAVKSFDGSKAKTMRGVIEVMAVNNGVAVVADNSWRAFKAVETIDVEWADAAYPPSSEDMWSVLENTIDGKKDSQRQKQGDVEQVFSEVETIEAEYRVPYLAHVPLEPMNAVVIVSDERVDIWTGTQIPDFIQKHAKEITGHKSENIHVHVMTMGGSFGRRLEDTYVMQAVEIANKMRGTPVKLTWSREEDFTHNYMRPMALAQGKGAVKDGKVQAFDLRVASQSIMGSQFKRLMGTVPPGSDVTITTGSDDQPYDIPNYRVRGYRSEEMFPVSSWRSVGASHNGFHHECFMDELIFEAQADPIEERIRLLENDPLSIKVIEEVAKMCAWHGSRSGAKGRGVAFTKSFGVRTAEIVEVEETRQGIKITNVWAAAEVGKVLDPVNFEAQFFGGIVWGLGHAMNCEITFKDYEVQQRNYHAYEGMRLYQTPNITVKGLENGERVLGMGEPGVPPAAPALANAIFALTGKRIRELPLHKHIRFA